MKRWILLVTLLVSGLLPSTSQAFEILGKHEDDPNTGGLVGVAILCTRQDVLAASTSTDGDYADVKCTAAGRTYTDADTELPAPAVLTDNMANPTVPQIAAHLMCWDVVGQNWDRCVGGINYNEDAASTGGEQLTILGAIRRDATTVDTSANGDYGTLVVDDHNALWINCRTGCSGGQQFAEDAASANADLGTMVLAKRTDTPAGQTSTDGDYGTLTLDSLNSLWVNCRTGCGAGVQKAEDSASADGDVGTLAMARRTATPANTSGTDLDYEVLQMNGGRLWVDASGVNLTTINAGTFATQETGAALTSLQLIDDIVGVEDNAEANGMGLARIGAVRRSTASASAGTDGDIATVNNDDLGRLWMRGGDPCQDHARITTTKISTAASGNVEQIALQSGQTIYVCGFHVVAGAATSVKFVYGTGSACATGQTDLTGAMAFAANGGIALPNAGAVQLKTASANALCTNNSGANAIAGMLTYVQTATP